MRRMFSTPLLRQEALQTVCNPCPGPPPTEHFRMALMRAALPQNECPATQFCTESLLQQRRPGRAEQRTAQLSGTGVWCRRSCQEGRVCRWEAFMSSHQGRCAAEGRRADSSTAFQRRFLQQKGASDVLSTAFWFAPLHKRVENSYFRRGCHSKTTARTSLHCLRRRNTTHADVFWRPSKSVASHNTKGVGPLTQSKSYSMTWLDSILEAFSN